MASENSFCRWLGRWRRVNTTTWLLASGREPQQPLDSRATGSGAGITEIPNQASWLRSRDRTGSAVFLPLHGKSKGYWSPRLGDYWGSGLGPIHPGSRSSGAHPGYSESYCSAYLHHKGVGSCRVRASKYRDHGTGPVGGLVQDHERG